MTPINQSPAPSDPPAGPSAFIETPSSNALVAADNLSKKDKKRKPIGEEEAVSKVAYYTIHPVNQNSRLRASVLRKRRSLLAGRILRRK